MARYHNYAKSLVNIYVRHVFREGVKRDTKNEELRPGGPTSTAPARRWTTS
jgi:hypothetical protein